MLFPPEVRPSAHPHLCEGSSGLAPLSPGLHQPQGSLAAPRPSLLPPALQPQHARGHGTTRGTPRLGRRAQRIQHRHGRVAASPCFGHRLSISYAFNSKSITASEALVWGKVLLEGPHRARPGAPGCIDRLPGAEVLTAPGEESVFQCKLQSAERMAAAELSRASPAPGALPQPAPLNTAPARSTQLCPPYATRAHSLHQRHVGPTRIS